MRIFRRQEETLNEQLLREAGLDRPESPPPSLSPPPFANPINPLGGPLANDALITARVPGIADDRVVFVAAPGGDLLVEDEHGDADLSPFADAVERNLSPPYRAVATRQSGDLWGIGAKRIDVRQFPFAGGDEIEVVSREGATSVTVDGSPTDVRIPELEQDGDFFVRASRLDGDLWEVEASAL